MRTRCPKCGESHLTIQVDTWADFHDGRASHFDAEDLQGLQPAEGAAAICRNCQCRFQVDGLAMVSPAELNKAYAALYPAEHPPEHAEDSTRIMGNWLASYKHDPASRVAKANWCGKVTRALFHALDWKQPRTVAAMLAILAGEHV